MELPIRTRPTRADIARQPFSMLQSGTVGNRFDATYRAETRTGSALGCPQGLMPARRNDITHLGDIVAPLYDT
jgi:hypothetical protein